MAAGTLSENVRSVAVAALRAGFAMVAALFLLFAIGPRTGMYRTLTVLSGSMRPTFSPGDVIVVTPERLRDIRVGQVIAYHIPIADRHVESHRVIRIIRGGAEPIILTKGDANSAPDPWNAELHGRIVWRLHGVVPKLGWLIIFLRSRLFHLLTVFLAPALLAGWGLVRIWSGSGEHAKEPSAAAV